MSDSSFTLMTEGSIGKRIVAFAFPLFWGNLFQQLYNTVDSVVVGNYVGDNALAAVGSAGPILNLLIVLFVGISVGAGIMVSPVFRRQGTGEAVYYHRQLHHADGDRHFVCHDSGLYGGKAAAGASGYAGAFVAQI